jgi:putative ABC transport system permease protein
VIPRLKTFPSVPVAAARFLEWRRSTQTFDSLALVGGASFTLTGSGEAERLYGARASGILWPMLGIEPQLGRVFRDDEDQPGRDRVVLLSDALWRGRFAADPRIVGRTIVLDREPHEIVGVLPADFQFPALSRLYGIGIAGDRPDLWTPIALRGGDLGVGNFNFICIGRLRPGVEAPQAEAELNALQAVLGKQLGPDELRATVIPLREQITGTAQHGLQLILAAASVVLLIACVNISSLLLARTASRRREFAIRMSIGASRGRLSRQMFVESLLLSTAGGLLAVVIAYASLQALLVYAPVDLPRAGEITLDARVVFFTAVAAMASGLVCGLLPAVRFSRPVPGEAMKFVSKLATSDRHVGRVQSGLVSVEVGLCVICLIAGGLLLRSLVSLLAVDRGFRAERVITVDFNLPAVRYPNAQQRIAFVRDILDALRTAPGVESVGLINRLPLMGQRDGSTIGPEDSTVPTMERPVANIRQVNTEYFQTMGIPLRVGRLFEARDGERPVTVISASTAKILWPAQDPIGKRLRIGAINAPRLYEVVGVVADVRTISLGDNASPTVYQPYWQTSFNEGSLSIKAISDRADTFSSVRATIRRFDPELPVRSFRTMDDLVQQSVAERQFQMYLVLLFGAIALFQASLGIFGVLSYSVAQRTNEIGVRMALGAERSRVMRLVLGESALMTGIGIAVGLLGAFLGTRYLESMLFDITPLDAPTFVTVSLICGFVATLASYLPARRATRIDPLLALRWE